MLRRRNWETITAGGVRRVTGWAILNEQKRLRDIQSARRRYSAARRNEQGAELPEYWNKSATTGEERRKRTSRKYAPPKKSRRGAATVHRGEWGGRYFENYL